MFRPKGHPHNNATASLRGSEDYFRSQTSRDRIEGLFEKANGQMGLRRATLRGRAGVNEQCLMTARAQNLKRIVNHSDGWMREEAASTFVEALFPVKASILIATKRLQPLLGQYSYTSLLYRKMCYESSYALA